MQYDEGRSLCTKLQVKPHNVESLVSVGVRIVGATIGTQGGVVIELPINPLQHRLHAKICSLNECPWYCFDRRWSFLFADGVVFAWEQMMIAAERPMTVARADQACLRFEHPSLATDLAAVGVLEGKIICCNSTCQPRGDSECWEDSRAIRLEWVLVY